MSAPPGGVVGDDVGVAVVQRGHVRLGRRPRPRRRPRRRRRSLGLGGAVVVLVQEVQGDAAVRGPAVAERPAGVGGRGAVVGQGDPAVVAQQDDAGPVLAAVVPAQGDVAVVVQGDPLPPAAPSAGEFNGTLVRERDPAVVALQGDPAVSGLSSAIPLSAPRVSWLSSGPPAGWSSSSTLAPDPAAPLSATRATSLSDPASRLMALGSSAISRTSLSLPTPRTRPAPPGGRRCRCRRGRRRRRRWPRRRGRRPGPASRRSRCPPRRRACPPRTSVGSSASTSSPSASSMLNSIESCPGGSVPPPGSPGSESSSRGTSGLLVTSRVRANSSMSPALNFHVPRSAKPRSSPDSRSLLSCPTGMVRTSAASSSDRYFLAAMRAGFRSTDGTAARIGTGTGRSVFPAGAPRSSRFRRRGGPGAVRTAAHR